VIRSFNIAIFYCRSIIYSNKDVLFGQKAVVCETMMLAYKKVIIIIIIIKEQIKVT